MPSEEVTAADSAADVSRRVCRRIRELRQKAGWSLDVLSQASGVSRSMLSQIEREQANPTLAVTVRIASAFGMSVADLVEHTHHVPCISVVRADDRSHMYRDDSECSIRTLSPLNLEKDVEFYEVRLSAGGCLKSSAHFEGTREFLTVQKGTVCVTSGDESSTLGRGDSATYRADLPHCISNTGRGESVMFLVVSYR